jgi:hypothetical protein
MTEAQYSTTFLNDPESKIHDVLHAAQRIYVDANSLVHRIAELNLDCEVLTFSPGVNAKKAYEHLTPSHIQALETAAFEVAKSLREVFWNEDADLATALARECNDSLHRLLYKAACIEEPFPRSVLLQPWDQHDPVFNDTFASPLEVLFEGDSSLQTIRIDRSQLPTVDDPRPPVPKLSTRLMFGNPLAKIYRLIQKFWLFSSLPGLKGRIVTVRDNELLKEAGYWLSLRGYSVVPLVSPLQSDITATNVEAEARIAAELPTICARAFNGLLCDRLIRAVTAAFEKSLVRTVVDYESEKQRWLTTLDKTPGNERPTRAVLTNTIGGASLAALHQVLRGKDIPLMVFQHGVTMEYHATHYLYGSQHETACAELAVLFNQRGTMAAERSIFRQGRGVAVGLPRDYGKRRQRRRAKGTPPIWYISTALYIGNRGVLFEGVSDGDKSDFETGVVQNVLAQLPHQVAFKAYPGRRFLDPLPEEIAVNQSDNVELIRDRVDMRYLFDAARILVTARSFSTPSWCIMSDLPVVHIDIPEQSPLTPEAREAFAAGVLFFDAGAPNFHSQLCDLLSKPVEEIEALYAAKQKARESLIKEYISDYGTTGAGYRAAAHIERLISSRSGQSNST